MSPKVSLLLLAAVYCCCLLSLSNGAAPSVPKNRLQRRLCALDSRYCESNSSKSQDEIVNEDDDNDENSEDSTHNERGHELEGAPASGEFDGIEERSLRRVTRRRNSQAAKRFQRSRNNRRGPVNRRGGRRRRRGHRTG